MLVDQLTICLPDSPGTLAELCRKIGEAGIQIHALAIATNADFGMFRIICDRPRTAAEVVKHAGYQVTVTKVVAVEVENRPGGLGRVLDRLASCDLNVEYAYSCSLDGRTIDIVKVSGEPLAIKLSDSGLDFVAPEELYCSDEP